ncbi:MAG: hypothetical protein NTV43_17150 [Methylococcales bacterium]|nr:hypothetical protein [Methylococcales bacterium]
MNAHTKSLTFDQLDELDTIHKCLSSIADLMSPCTDLHTVNRDDLALLMRYFTDRLQKVTKEAV